MSSLVLLSSLVLVLLCQVSRFQQLSGDDLCSQNAGCSSCIQTSGCSWCPDRESNGTTTRHARCISQSSTSQCTKNLISPKNEITYVRDEALQGGENPVQIKPQYVKLKLRVGEPFDLPLNYDQAEDYPVDLYYLMDLSASMEDDKDKLSNLGNKLAEVMRKLTKNFKLGFGSFVDKVTMPFVSTVPERLEKPCGDDRQCVPPYSFKNHLPLDTDTRKFAKMVNDSKVSGNLDSPEGGFDALMQSIVCTKEIGWREQARHLLVFSTDASFHLAGDGKLAGIVVPNDGLCHLSNNALGKEYYLKYDYPSIAQLNLKAQENNINVIFAVVNTHASLYETLKDHIDGASFGALSHDSSNVVGLVGNVSEKLVQSVTLSDNSNEFISVDYSSDCPIKSTKANVCGGLQNNVVVNFIATITVAKCPTNPADRIQHLIIKPGAVNENLTVEIEIICDCPCERPGHQEYEENSASCNAGTSKCGVCDCTEGKFGESCQCEGNELDQLVERCIGPDNVTCSNQGSCRCGECDCKKRKDGQKLYYGSLCQCEDHSCPRVANVICTDPTHGTCKCGMCKCDNAWSGDACDCATSKDKCIAPGSNKVCSDHGTCPCNLCICNKLSEDSSLAYSGDFCEDCPTCGHKCDELRSCVQCEKDSTTPCTRCDDGIEVTKVDSLDDEAANTEHKCYIRDNDGCTHKFNYAYVEGDSKKLIVRKKNEKECPPEINVLGIVFGIVGGTVVIGLLLLIVWKILTSIHDRREYVKFEKERAMSNWGKGENPLYKPSTSTFSNPTFGNK